MTIRLSGGPELLALLDQLPKNLERNIIRGGLRAGAKVIQQQARANVPVESGQLRRAIGIGTRTEGARLSSYVKLRGPGSYIGHFIEYGVSPHLIKVAEEARPIRNTRRGPRRLSMGTINKMVARGSLVIGGNFVGPMVHHPGHAPKPFLRPALDQKAQEAVAAMGAYIAQRFQIGDLRAPTLSVDTEE
ncbi:MAG: HK97 gp10 family phage protein [Sphingomonadales bacterium]|nr:HK97 gp10 family phage protein [Sphingomonadales bacterium]